MRINIISLRPSESKAVGDVEEDIDGVVDTYIDWLV